MNIFRIAGDLAHLASIFILLNKMRTSRSCAGISFKSQLMFLTVYLTRYIDLFHKFFSAYNTLMKITFITMQAYVCYLMKWRYKPTNDNKIDVFRVEFLLAGALILSLFFHYKGGITEIIWSFSIWLEAGAILPQMLMLSRTGEAETVTVNYILAIGLYRALYIPNWIYRYFAENFVDPIAIVAGIIQTGLYTDFAFVYYNTIYKGLKFELPA